MANWDPSYSMEAPNWYGEYVARHGPISISWLQEPMATWGAPETKREVRGAGIFRDGSQCRIIAPIDDGSVCLWEAGVGRTEGLSKRGAIIARSQAGLLSVNGSAYHSTSKANSTKSSLINSGVVECVSVDNFRKKAYFAVQSGLNEVDLETLQVSAHYSYPFPISALSEAAHPWPLTVGTTCSLHLHDPRQRRTNGSDSDDEDRVEAVADFPSSPKPRKDFYRLLAGDRPTDFAPLFQPGPVSILHLGSNSNIDSSDGQIYVAGRFPSILMYDRRTFPKLRDTLFSGSRLCSLTSLPYAFKVLESELMRKNELSTEDAYEARSKKGQTLIACGEYNGKGSLEIFGLSTDSTGHTIAPSLQAASSQTSTLKNRVSASRSKLLSVATHGTRIVYSDGDGSLKWVERDGSTLVRRWNINQYQTPPIAQSDPTNVTSQHGIDLDIHNPGYGIFNSCASAGDVARKIIPMNEGTSVNLNSTIDQDELLIWTGERLGILGFRKKPAFAPEDFEEKWESVEEKLKRREEQIYGQTMRRALERHADGVRFVRGLGMGDRF
ncbi:hypothetical protein MMC09_004798 [Bachmanniomyces sp. S44760]|nr:hypothetical protein [Bachmanniomyces sp. S44760]